MNFDELVKNELENIVKYKSKSLTEAEEVDLEYFTIAERDKIKKLGAIFNAKPEQFFSGIHGAIVTFPTRNGAPRLDLNDLKKIVSLKIRWLETDDDSISVGM